ncbi:MAG TPA: hypothetical protein VMV49_03485 [Candidatus Deferrimicrobium sp.]|nr:hypothetical protein [Candidatus Deferrimicrobium sp.]
MNPPKVAKVLHEHGIVADEIDWNIAKLLMNERGTGYTACSPSLVELEGGIQAIKFMIDFTAVEEDGVYGYGVVGELLSDTQGNIIWCSPQEIMDQKRDELVATVQPQKRPSHY